ncbi:MAG: polysaccharide pyruvyl transferase family protein [Lachnospiraceae bacterium]|nr:polysaccharide pyruvyl transferase family protein [Lachnospiraceae bacterium]
MKRKVGILTYHDALNYGAVLQAYALRRSLRKIGVPDVEVIDYKNPEVMSAADLKGLLFSGGIKGILLFVTRIGVVSRFKRFRVGKLHLSKELKTQKEFEEYVRGLDHVVVGSDQVWNEKWNNCDEVFFLNVDMDNNKKGSYAASFGFEQLEEDKKEIYKKRLSGFSSLSVREHSAKEIVENTLGLSCEQNIDPVLLLNREEWEKITVDIKPKKPYILLYLVPYQKEVVEYAVKLAKEKGMKILMASRSFRNWSLLHVGSSSPEKFLGLVKNADMVITNSFHGTAFSVVFEKKAVIMLNNARGYNVRSRDLLAMCKIVDEDFKGEKVETDNVDWTFVKQVLKKEQSRSKKYLKDMLNGKES